MDKKLILTFVVILAITAGIGVAVFVTAWTNPSGNPPTGSGSGIIPSGLILYFASSTCPTGWSEVTAARGRYIVGLPSSGSVSSTVGTALSNSENRAVGEHSHGINDPGHSHILDKLTGWSGVSQHLLDFNEYNAEPSGPVYTVSAVTGITVNASGTTAGTNAPYIQFLVCQKN